MENKESGQEIPVIEVEMFELHPEVDHGPLTFPLDDGGFLGFDLTTRPPTLIYSHPAEAAPDATVGIGYAPDHQDESTQP